MGLGESVTCPLWDVKKVKKGARPPYVWTQGNGNFKRTLAF